MFGAIVRESQTGPLHTETSGLQGLGSESRLRHSEGSRLGAHTGRAAACWLLCVYGQGGLHHAVRGRFLRSHLSSSAGPLSALPHPCVQMRCSFSSDAPVLPLAPADTTAHGKHLQTGRGSWRNPEETLCVCRGGEGHLYNSVLAYFKN